MCAVCVWTIFTFVTFCICTSSLWCATDSFAESSVFCATRACKIEETIKKKKTKTNMEADNGPTNVAALPAAGKYMLNQNRKKEKQRKIIPFDWSVIFVKGGRRVLCSYINSAHLARKLRNCWCRRKFFFFCFVFSSINFSMCLQHVFPNKFLYEPFMCLWPMSVYWSYTCMHPI